MRSAFELGRCDCLHGNNFLNRRATRLAVQVALLNLSYDGDHLSLIMKITPQTIMAMPMYRVTGTTSLNINRPIRTAKT